MCDEEWHQYHCFAFASFLFDHGTPRRNVFLTLSQNMALLYLAQYYSDDVESQKRGMVVVIFPTSNFDPISITDPAALRDLRSTIVTAALRPASIHICLSDAPFHRAVGSLFRAMFPTQLAVRIRIHTGKVHEIGSD